MRGVTDGRSMDNDKDEMGRLTRLEENTQTLLADVGVLKTVASHTAEILADHSQRFTQLQRTMDERFGALDQRLDRLINMTMQERTAGAERLGNIEARLTRLEKKVGV